MNLVSFRSGSGEVKMQSLALSPPGCDLHRAESFWDAGLEGITARNGRAIR